MPELPEVETVCLGLATKMVGRRLDKVELRRSNLRFPIPPTLSEKAAGATIKDITRRAKYIQIILDNGLVLLLHLGMSGRILERTPEEAHAKHDHVIFHLSSVSADGLQMVLHDPRRFGMLDMAEYDNLNDHPFFKNLGIEPLEGSLNGQWLHQHTRNRKTPIKAFLLDQRHIVGIGNIYACEALFEAAIHPARLCHTLNGDDCMRLSTAIQNVLTRAIAAGGSSLRDYIQVDGTLGYFQTQFAVYSREGEACPKCKVTNGKCIIKRLVQSGRSSFFCSATQRA